MTYFFHAVGTLLKRRRIDLALVDDLMQTIIIQFWEKMEPIIKEMRKQLNFPRAGWTVEYLFNELKKREQLEAITIR